MNVEGGCLCGAVRIKSTGQAIHKALCHCLDCRKITGSTYSTNLVVPNTGFTLTKGTPKEYHHHHHQKPATDSGNNTITISFCGTCGSTLWSRSSTYGETTVLKAGILDDDDDDDKNNNDNNNVICGEEGGGEGRGKEGKRVAWEDQTRPSLELYTKRRPLWVAAVEGAVQHLDGSAQKEA